jgi:transketolase C-terminal domain/subunit
MMKVISSNRVTLMCCEGKDIALVAMGSTVHEIVAAATQLAEAGIEASVISVPSIRPCDTRNYWPH